MRFGRTFGYEIPGERKKESMKRRAMGEDGFLLGTGGTLKSNTETFGEVV